MAELLPWTCYVISVQSGAVLAELVLVDEPRWSAAINDEGSLQVTVLLTEVASAALKSFGTDGGRIGIALAYGEAPNGKIVQAGPVWQSAYNDRDRTLTLSCRGLWSVLNRRLLVSPNWAAPANLVDSSFDSIYADRTLKSIANDLVRDCLIGGLLPIDLPLSSAETGTHSRTYPSHEMASYGTRLMELTQVAGGPDILFNPYFSGPANVRWQMIIGDPYITQSGLDPTFDYPGSLYYLDTQTDNSGRATEVIVRGNGSERALTYSYASSNELLSVGWPRLAFIDTSHTSASDQATLDGWSSSILGQQTDPVETWSTSAKIAGSPGLESYLPGFRVKYTVNDHPWVADGDYRFRLLGYAGTGSPGEVQHILDARGVDN